MKIAVYQSIESVNYGTKYFSHLPAANYKTFKRTTPYHPTFGSVMEGRVFSSGTYRFGFNGQEKDDEIYGEGNTYSAEFWEYDARVGRRWNVDPVYSHGASNYSCFSNRPLVMIDPNGKSDYYTSRGRYLGSDGTSNTEIMIVSNNRVKRDMIRSNRRALRKDEYVIYNKEVEADKYLVLPPKNQRDIIKKQLESYNPEVNSEMGGRGIRYKDHEGNSQYEHFRSKDGAVVKDGKVAEIDLHSTHEVDQPKTSNVASDQSDLYYWHTHTKLKHYVLVNGKLILYSEFKMNSTENSTSAGGEHHFIGGPSASIPDKENVNGVGYTPGAQHYVLYKDSNRASDGVVTEYSKGRNTSMSLNFFLNVKVKSKP